MSRLLRVGEAISLSQIIQKKMGNVEYRVGWGGEAPGVLPLSLDEVGITSSVAYTTFPNQLAVVQQHLEESKCHS